MALTVDEMAQVSLLMQEALANHMPIGRHGMVVPGSYNPETATVDVVLCDAAIVFPDDQQTQPMVEQAVPLASTHIDDTHGPFGGEPCFLASVQGGYVAHIHRTPSAGVDSNNVPVGERWIQLRNAASNLLAYIRMTQNAAGASDGLGAIRMLVGGLLSIATHAGWSITLDDTANVFTIQAPGTNGLFFSMNAATSKVLIGATGLGIPDELVTKSDLQTAIAAIEAAYNSHTHVGVSTGSGVSGAPSTPMAVTATGSSTVEGKE